MAEHEPQANRDGEPPIDAARLRWAVSDLTDLVVEVGQQGVLPYDAYVHMDSQVIRRAGEGAALILRLLDSVGGVEGLEGLAEREAAWRERSNAMEGELRTNTSSLQALLDQSPRTFPLGSRDDDGVIVMAGKELGTIIDGTNEFLAEQGDVGPDGHELTDDEHLPNLG